MEKSELVRRLGDIEWEDFDYYKISFPTVTTGTREKTREKILALIKENPEITMRELADITGLTEKGIEWNIARLREEGKLRRVGPAKGGHWEVVE